jgi:hypothetical protein
LPEEAQVHEDAEVRAEDGDVETLEPDPDPAPDLEPGSKTDPEPVVLAEPPLPPEPPLTPEPALPAEPVLTREPPLPLEPKVVIVTPEEDVPPSEYGQGSALPARDGTGPRGWPVKGNADSYLFHTAGSPGFRRGRADVWFRDEEAATKAGFVRWDAHQR